jgi:pyruvate,water dikinase
MTTAQPETGFPLPDDVDGFWLWDKVHAPRPVRPLSEEIVLGSIGPGFTAALEEVSYPAVMHVRCFNGYPYSHFTQADLKGEPIGDRIARYQQQLNDLVPRVGQLWNDEWLPSVIPQVEKQRGLDFASMSDADLWKALDEAVEGIYERWLIHGRINLVLVAATWLTDFYKEHFKPETPTEAYHLIQGVPTQSMETGRVLWRLSRVAANSPALRKLFSETDSHALEGALAQSEEGRAFLAQLNDYLVKYGWRSDQVYDIAEPTWLEDRSIPLNTLQGYIQLGDDADPDALYKAAVKRREEMLAACRAKLASEPEKLARFNELYEAARWTLPLTEDHNFWIDQMGVTLLRRPALELGSRMVDRGTLADKNDVFYLYLAEIKAGMAGTDQKPLAAQRKAEWERASAMVPPLTIGPVPKPTGDAFEEALLFRMFGFGQVEPDREQDIISGIPASPGSVRGTAKVVRTLNEASKLQKGDIMFCEMTLPPWTPLFSTVSAVVADTGGVLSHCAIVAREYRLPAVVGTVVGTKAVKDGWTVTVDGSKGVVRIESR